MAFRRAAALAALLTVLVSTSTAAAGPGRTHEGPLGEVAIFFYPWYGTPERDGVWQHWNQNAAAPPAGIASQFFPLRGVYSSSDRNVLAAQLDEIVGAGVTTLVVSWWGPGSAEAARLPLVAREATRRGLRVAVHVEPYGGRQPAGLVGELSALRALGVADAYVYDSTATPDAEWAAALPTLDGMRVFAHTSLPGKALAGGFTGLYTYDVLIHDGRSFRRICASARALGLVCAPSVGPGFDARRATGDGRTRSRRDGRTYDAMWRSAIQAAADIVTITSYNEWHEGTQIEPARRRAAYEAYDGAWGLRGASAERAYLDRTATWAGAYASYLSGSAAALALAQYSAEASRRR